MTRDNRQILINPHSSVPKVPAGALNLGEIAVQHDSVSGAALYVETVADSQVEETVAKFINEVAINELIASAHTDLQTKIDSINTQVGLPHTGTTGETHHWDQNTTVWEAIEETYADMTAGTAAANTKIEKAGNEDTSKYMTLTSTTDSSTSSITYTIGLQGIDDAINEVSEKVEALSAAVESFSSATVERFESVETMVEELSAATTEVIGDLNYTGVTQEGKPVVNVTQTDGLVAAETGTIDAQYVTVGTGETPLDEVIEDILDEIDANEVEVAKLTAEEVAALQDENVKEAYKLIHSDDENRTAVGDIVKIYKDSALYDAYLGHVDDEITSADDPTVIAGSGDTALCLIYYKADGTYELVPIDVSNFLAENEFADGLQVVDHIVSVKVDPTSEQVVIDESGATAPVLSVSEDGVKVSNIQNAINAAVSELAHNVDADVTGVSQDGHVTVEVIQEDAELKQVIVTTDDIASADELDAAEEAVGLAADGSHVQTNGYYTSAATTVVGEIAALDSALHEVSEELGDVEVFETGSTNNWVTLTVDEAEAGKTGLTLDDSALADKLIDLSDAIEAETTARENADLELLGNSASTSAETSIMGLTKLIEQLTSEANDNAVQNAEFAAVATKDTSDEGSNAGIAVVDNQEGGKKIQLDLSVLKLDCGEY